jgi:hypothetical protein
MTVRTQEPTMSRRRCAVAAASISKVTFRSTRTGEELACFEHQTRRQVELLMAHPPAATRYAPYEIVVTPIG